MNSKYSFAELIHWNSIHQLMDYSIHDQNVVFDFLSAVLLMNRYFSMILLFVHLTVDDDDNVDSLLILVHLVDVVDIFVEEIIYFH
jgi:hypothetical protein